MIGKITSKSGIEIVLDDDKKIQCSDRRLEEFLQKKLKRYSRGYSVADGVFGIEFLYDLAEDIGGKVEIEPKEESESSEEVIY